MKICPQYVFSMSPTSHLPAHPFQKTDRQRKGSEHVSFPKKRREECVLSSALTVITWEAATQNLTHSLKRAVPWEWGRGGVGVNRKHEAFHSPRRRLDKAWGLREYHTSARLWGRPATPVVMVRCTSPGDTWTKKDNSWKSPHNTGTPSQSSCPGKSAMFSGQIYGKSHPMSWDDFLFYGSLLTPCF